MPTPKIKQLPDELIAIIAAGEVIEQPVDVVKELIENAIDAQATAIQITLENGGLAAISVKDNGVGMSPEDVQIAYKAHATSKLQSFDDFKKIYSLGFRGEGLASIAQTSKLTITSRTADAAVGTTAIISNGKLKKTASTASAIGTTITVTQLFKAIPARAAFLQSANNSLKKISSLITQYAIAFPEIQWQLENNDNLIVSFDANQDTITRLNHIWGSAIWDNHLKLETAEKSFKIRAHLVAPHNIPQRHDIKQLFVNQRPVTDNKLTANIKKGFGTLLHAKTQPGFVVHVEIDPKLLDVNVHPKKQTISFASASKLYQQFADFFKEAIPKKISQQQGYNFKKSAELTFKDSSQSTDESLHGQLFSDQSVRQLSEQNMEEQTVLQIANTYLVYQQGTQLIVVDQHAAHERIILEKLKKKIATDTSKISFKKLAKPQTVKLSPTLQLTYQEHEQAITRLGFSVTQTGETEITLRAVPQIIDEANGGQVFVSVLEDLNQEHQLPNLEQYVEHTLVFVACRSAVQAGDQLAPEQRRELLRQLSETPNNTSCPHGRPIFQTFDAKLFNSYFKR